MRAIILAGGRGTRLAPFTTVFPKPLVPLGEKPIIDIIIRQLANHGINDITLIVGHLAELIQAYFQNLNGQMSGVNISYIKEKKPMGTAGSLGLLTDMNDTFLVMNGDILTALDYSKLITYHKEKRGIMTIGMYMKKIKIDLGVIEADENYLLTSYLEKPEKIYPVSMGVYVYEPEVLKYIEPDKFLDFPDLVIKLIRNGEKVYGYPSDDYWLDIGRHDDYHEAQEMFNTMKKKFLPDTDW